MIHLEPDFARRLPEPWTSMDQVLAVQGTLYRAPPGARRRTLRFELDGHGYFLKLHLGVGWGEIFKNLASARLPVVGACNEWRAIRTLERLGIETLPLAAWGREGWNPARRRSFVVTAELSGTVSLEDYCARWSQQPPPPALKRTLIRRVAQITRTLHRHGLNHRDLYLCHFLLRQPWHGDETGLHLHLIDLHRMQQRRRVPHRWQAKDLGSLWFSAMEIGLTRRDRLRFLQTYFRQDLRTVLRRHRRLLRASERRARMLSAKGIPHA